MKRLFAAGALVLAGLLPVLRRSRPPTRRTPSSRHQGRPRHHPPAPDLAPKHVEQIKTLTKQGFYNGVVFHRVIDGFMAQTGDPTGTGTGKSDLPNVPAEFTPTPFKRGAVGMARSQSPDSANSQFFICYEGCGPLTGQYTLFGEVVSGMDVVDKIKRGSRQQRHGLEPRQDREDAARRRREMKLDRFT